MTNTDPWCSHCNPSGGNGRHLCPSHSTAAIPLPWPKPPLTGNRTRGNPYARASEVKQVCRG